MDQNKDGVRSKLIRTLEAQPTRTLLSTHLISIETEQRPGKNRYKTWTVSLLRHLLLGPQP
jgi:hypothetical protein